MPAGRRSELAVKRFSEALGSVTTCVTAQRLEFSSPFMLPDEAVSARFLAPASLRSPAGGPSGLFLDVSTIFTVVPAEREDRLRRLAARTEMYEYRLLDHDHTELLVYHWQPGAAYAGPDEPHLHVSASLNARVDAVSTRSIGLDKFHIPTGLVSLAAVVRMLIEEFGIAPQRPDWRATLDRIETAF